jgi:hypothetical protein
MKRSKVKPNLDDVYKKLQGSEILLKFANFGEIRI